MSFNWYARKVRNATLGPGVRRSAFYSCLLRLSWMTHERFHETIARYDAQFHFHARRTTEAPLLAALTAMERERNGILEKLRAFERKRMRAKMRGNRRLSAAEAQALRALAQPHQTVERKE